MAIHSWHVPRWGIRLLASLFIPLGFSISATAVAQETKPVRIGVPTSVQLQVGRDTLTAIKMAVDEVNKKGGVLGHGIN
jgi:branched-chain amino acid transport system substrate-binding protein